MVERLFLVVPRGCLQFVIVVFPNHTHLLFLYLSISNDIVSTKIYDKRGNFDFVIVNFPCLDGDVSRSYGVYSKATTWKAYVVVKLNDRKRGDRAA